MTISTLENTCPDCGHVESDSSLPPHGSPGNPTVASLLCTVRIVARALGGDPMLARDLDPGSCGRVLEDALRAFAG